MNLWINVGLILLVIAELAVLAFVIMANLIKRQREEQFRFEQKHS
jgi:hypothetical protein